MEIELPLQVIITQDSNVIHTWLSNAFRDVTKSESYTDAKLMREFEAIAESQSMTEVSEDNVLSHFIHFLFEMREYVLEMQNDIPQMIFRFDFRFGKIRDNETCVQLAIKASHGQKKGSLTNYCFAIYDHMRQKWSMPPPVDRDEHDC